MSEDVNTIPLKTAEEWTDRWRNVESGYNKHRECNGFLVPLEDLKEVIAEMEGQVVPGYIRAYLGVETGTGNEKLIIVGTQPEPQKDGTVIYRDMVPGNPGIIETGSGNIYDFSKSVPPAADPNSPLN